MSIGNKLKTKRNQLKLTMDDVANALKVSRQTIYKYENGIIKNIPLDKINKLAELLEVSPTFLTGWEEQLNEWDNILNSDKIKAEVEVMKLAQKHSPELYKLLYSFYNELNDDGRAEAINRIDELTYIKKYQIEQE